MTAGKHMGRKVMAAMALGAVITMAFSGPASAEEELADGSGMTAQEAVIVYGDGQEEMTLRVDCRGAPGGSWWLVPLPSRPVIDEADPRLFNYLELNCGLGSIAAAQEVDKAFGPGSAAILESTVVVPSDQRELEDWLRDSGLACGSGQLAAFQYYIDRGWCFAAFRSAPCGPAGPGPIYTKPLRFTFSTPRAVFSPAFTCGDVHGASLTLWAAGAGTCSCGGQPGKAAYAVSPGESDGLEAFLPLLRSSTGSGGGIYISGFERVLGGEESPVELVFEADPVPVAMPEDLPFLSMGTSSDSPRRPSRISVLLALAILVLSLAAIPILFRNRKQNAAWRLFTGLCATFVTMAVVATLAMALLYQEARERLESSAWEGLGVTQQAVFTSTEVLPAGEGTAGTEPYVMLKTGSIMPDGRVEEGTGVILRMDDPDCGAGCVMSPDGRQLAVTGDGGVCVIDIDDYPAEAPGPREAGGGERAVREFAWSEDGSMLASLAATEDGDGHASASVDLYDAESGSVINSIALQDDPERSTMRLEPFISGEYLIICREDANTSQDALESLSELVLYNVLSGEKLASLGMSRPFSPLLIKGSGEGEFLLLGLGRSEEAGDMVLWEYKIRMGDLKVLEKSERVLELDKEAGRYLEGVLEQDRDAWRFSLDEKGRYLLARTRTDRTVLLDLAEGDALVISGLGASWLEAR